MNWYQVYRIDEKEKRLSERATILCYTFISYVVTLLFKDQDKQNCNFACCFKWVFNLIVNIAGGKEAEGV